MNKELYFKTAEQYLTALPSMKKSKHTVTTYHLALSKFSDFLNSLSDNVSTEITPSLIVDYQSYLVKTGIKTNTVRYYLIALHAFFEYCVDMDIIEKQPIDTRYMPGAEKIEYDLLTLDEIKMLLAQNPSVDKTPMLYRAYAIVSLLILTGIRNRELRYLRVSDLDFAEHTIRITKKSAKGSKERRTAFPTKAREIIKKYLDSGIRPATLSDDDYLFGTYADEHGHKNSADVEWHALSSCGLTTIVKTFVGRVTGHKMIGSHDLRHAYASLASDMGVATRQLSLSMGHSSELITEKVYISILDESKAANVVNSVLDNI